MQPIKDASRSYEVERRMHYATRPGFRIAELQISQTQRIPWHYHSEVQDTFYVIDGTIRIFTREPEEEVCLTAGQTYAVRPGRPHLVTNAGDTSAVFLVLQGLVCMISLLWPDGERRLLRQALKVGWGQTETIRPRRGFTASRSQLVEAIHFHTNDMIFSAAFFRKEADRERVGNGIRNLREPSVHLRLSP